MASLLASIVAQPSRNQHLLLIQSSTARTCLPVLRAIIKRASEQTREASVLFCFLYPPSSFLDLSLGSESIRVVDRTDKVPGYDGPDVPMSDKPGVNALKEEVIEAVRSCETLPFLA